MEKHQERVVAEKKDLDEKIVKLSAFLFTSATSSLVSEDEWHLMKGQMYTMIDYSSILAGRISNFA